MIQEPRSRRMPRAVVLGVLAGLCGVAAWCARGTGAPATRTPVTTLRAPADPARVAPALALSPDRLDLSAADPPIPLAGATDVDGAALPEVAGMPPGPRADEHRPPPPEAIGIPQLRASGPDRDTGLVFQSEPPGDAEPAKSKGRGAATLAPSSGPAPPPVTADVRSPAEPVDIAPQPARPDRDTGLVFSNQPPRSADASGEKR
jgi:hypothetical protein